MYNVNDSIRVHANRRVVPARGDIVGSRYGPRVSLTITGDILERHVHKSSTGYDNFLSTGGPSIRWRNNPAGCISGRL